MYTNCVLQYNTMIMIQIGKSYVLLYNRAGMVMESKLPLIEISQI